MRMPLTGVPIAEAASTQRSDHVAAESSKKPAPTRMGKVEGERHIQVLDCDEKLIIAID